MELNHLLEVAKTAAKKAGEKILEIYNSDDFDVQVKEDNSPLTRADKAAHEDYTKYLGILNLPILSEEGRSIPYEERKAWEYFWMVDPLDGTKEFIKRNGEFTVNIALIHKGQSVLGVVYAPVLDSLFYGHIGYGAFRDVKGDIQQIHTSEFTSDRESLRVVASRSHLNSETQTFIDQLQSPQIVSLGSSLKFLIVAQGDAEYYPRFAPTMEWDTAAAQVLVEEAGGSVIVQQSQEKMIYNKEDLLNPHFLVRGKEK